jgi:hypothetical protein
MLSRKEIAAGLGIDPGLVTRYRRAGMPSTSIQEAAAWKAANVRQRITARAPVNGHTPTKPEAPPAPAANPYQDARTRWAIAEANERELSLLERKGVLVHRDKVRTEVARLLVGLRQSMLQMPARLQSVLAAESDEAKVHEILQDEVYSVLAQISEVK